MEKKRSGFDKIEQNYSFELKEEKWRILFYFLFALFLFAGVLGFFGDGILSKRTLDEKAFNLEYQRFLRENTPSELKINFYDSKGTLAVGINRDYLEKVELQKVVPQPESVEIIEDEFVYYFNAQGEGLISFFIKPQGSGPKSLEISVQGEKNQLNQFVYF